MTQTELDLFLQRAICCAATFGEEVALLYLSNSDIADCKFNRLVVLVDSIEALKCYTADTEETVYTVTLTPGDPGHPDSSSVVETTTTTAYDNCLDSDQFDILVDNITEICNLCDCD